MTIDQEGIAFGGSRSNAVPLLGGELTYGKTCWKSLKKGGSLSRTPCWEVARTNCWESGKERECADGILTTTKEEKRRIVHEKGGFTCTW